MYLYARSRRVSHSTLDYRGLHRGWSDCQCGYDSYNRQRTREGLIIVVPLRMHDGGLDYTDRRVGGRLDSRFVSHLLWKFAVSE
jgi:hypothetical protein